MLNSCEQAETLKHKGLQSDMSGVFIIFLFPQSYMFYILL